MATRTFSVELDEDDERSVHEAIAKQQLMCQPFGGCEKSLPEGESNLPGALLAEVCRGWIEYIDWLDSKGKNHDA